MRKSLAAPLAAVVLLVAASPAVAATAKPAVTSLSSHYSAVSGGTRIVVHGARFTGVRSVHFGKVAGTSVRVASSSSLSVVVPKHAAGLVDVTISTSHGTSPVVAADHVRFVAAPTVTSVSPSSGAAMSATKVTVHGANFLSVERVAFGSVLATQLKVLSSSTLTLVAPKATTSVTVNVRVRTKYGLSALTVHDRFAYHAGPAPVAGLSAVSSSTSTGLTWAWSSSPSASSVDIRRAIGTTPPGPTGGTLVATLDAPAVDPSDVNPPLMRYRDLALLPATTYAYTLVVHTASGAVSEPTSVVTTTASSPAVPAPIALSTSPSSDHPVAGPCQSVSGFLGSLGGGYFTVAADIADPDFPSRQLRFQTKLLQTDPHGVVSTIVDFGDPAGTSNLTSASGGLVSAFLSNSSLTSGDRYTLSLRAFDGTATSAATTPCSFGYDATPPTVEVTGPTTAHVGKPITFTFSGTDPASPNSGAASGVTEFRWSTAFQGDPGVAIAAHGSPATATLTLTPTVWGSANLFVTSVDRAGNRSATETFQFYVSG